VMGVQIYQTHKPFISRFYYKTSASKEQHHATLRYIL
jgi:hypothetical protein